MSNRQRNRQHAKKHRLKKKSITKILEESREDLKAENEYLRQQIGLKLGPDVQLPPSSNAAATDTEASSIMDQSKMPAIASESVTAQQQPPTPLVEQIQRDGRSSGSGSHVLDDATLSYLKTYSDSVVYRTRKPDDDEGPHHGNDEEEDEDEGNNAD